MLKKLLLGLLLWMAGLVVAVAQGDMRFCATLGAGIQSIDMGTGALCPTGLGNCSVDKLAGRFGGTTGIHADENPAVDVGAACFVSHGIGYELLFTPQSVATDTDVNTFHFLRDEANYEYTGISIGDARASASSFLPLVVGTGVYLSNPDSSL